MEKGNGSPWRVASLAATLAVATWVALRLPLGLAGSNQSDVALLLLAMVTLWLSRVLPLPLASLAILLCAAALGRISLDAVFSGFASPALFFLVGVYFISQTLKVTGTLHKLLLTVLGRQRHLPAGGVAWTTPLLILASASVLPSAGARAAVLKPVYDQLLSAENDGAALRRYTMLLLGNLSSMVSRAFLSGGPGVIVIAGIMDAARLEMSWGTWLQLMGLPVLLIVMLTAALHVAWLRPHASRPVVVADAPGLSRYDWYVLAVLALLVVAWITEWPFGDEPAVPALVAAILLSIHFPWAKHRVRLRDLDWETLFFAGIMLSISRVLLETGTGRYLGELLLSHLAALPTRPLLLVGILLALLILRLPLLGGGAYSAITYPMVLGMSEVLQVSPILLALLVALAGGITLLPTQSHSGLIAAQDSGYTFGESLVSGLFLLAATILIMLLVGAPLWDLLLPT